MKTTVAIMGIVNVTPDSFSDGGQHFSCEAAVAHAESLIAQGAHWVDVGGESTRPGAAPVSIEDELARVVPVIAELRRRRPGAAISVDTSKPEVAEAAISEGASLVNDVTAFADPRMVEVVAKSQASACLMHMAGTPRTMQDAPHYEDVVAEVLHALNLAVRRAEAAGISRERLYVDPGIGFGKTIEHNLALLRNLGQLRALGCKVLLGTSRKSFLGKLIGGAPPEGRVLASVVSVAVLAARGDVDVVRVHDVAETREALAIALAV